MDSPVRILRGSRPSRDAYFAELTRVVAQRATCARRAVGCVLINAEGHILATGYNGVCRGTEHCIDKPCPGAHQPSGQGLHLCEAIHAEQNALLQCRNINEIHTAFVTASPCISCMRLLVNTGVCRIVFLEEYPHDESRRLAQMLNISWELYRPD
jgi:dCMP deaminase